MKADKLVAKRKTLRKKLRKSGWHFLLGNTPNPKQRKWIVEYNRLGEKLWEERFPNQWLDAPFGGDMTATTIVDEKGERKSIHELGKYILGGPNSEKEFLKADLATKPIYRNGVRFEEKIKPGIVIDDPGDYEEIEGYE